MKKFNVLFVMILTQLLLLAGCKNMFSTELVEGATTVNVKFSANVGSSQRTVMPQRIKPEELSSLTLYGNADGEEEKLIKAWKSYAEFGEDTLSFEKRIWNFRLTAAYGEYECFEAETTVNLVETTKIEFELSAVPDGLGDLNLTLVIPESESPAEYYSYVVVPVKDYTEEMEEEITKILTDEIENQNELSNVIKEKSENFRFGYFMTDDLKEIEKNGKTITISEKGLKSDIYLFFIYTIQLDTKSYAESVSIYYTIAVITPGHISSAEVELGKSMLAYVPEMYEVSIDGSFKCEVKEYSFLKGNEAFEFMLKQYQENTARPADTFAYYDKYNDLCLWDFENNMVSSDVNLLPVYNYRDIENTLSSIPAYTGDCTLRFYSTGEKTGEDPSYGDEINLDIMLKDVSVQERVSVALDLSLVKMGYEKDNGFEKEYSIKIPAEYAYGRTWLKSIVLPQQKEATDTDCGLRAFAGCANLESITINAGRTPDKDRYSELDKYTVFDAKEFDVNGTPIKQGVFYDCHSLSNVYWRGSVNSYLASFKESEGVETVLCASPFENSSSSEKNIWFYNEDENEYEKCVNLVINDFYIENTPEDDYSYGNYAFKNCTSLKILTYSCTKEPPYYSNFVGEQMFANCRNLTTATINCYQLNDNEFMECSNLKDVYVGSGVNYIESYFWGLGSASPAIHFGDYEITVDDLGNMSFSGSYDYLAGNYSRFKDFYEGRITCAIKKIWLENVPTPDMTLTINEEEKNVSVNDNYDNYQWYMNGVEITGETGNALELSRLSLVDNVWTAICVIAEEYSYHYSRYLQVKKTGEDNYEYNYNSNNFGTLYQYPQKNIKIEIKMDGDDSTKKTIASFENYESFANSSIYINSKEIDFSDKLDLMLTGTPLDDQSLLKFNSNQELSFLYTIEKDAFEDNNGIGMQIEDTLVWGETSMECTCPDDKYYKLTFKTYGYNKKDTKDYNLAGNGTIARNTNGNWILADQYILTVEIYDSSVSTDILGIYQSVINIRREGIVFSIPEIELN